MRLDCVIPFWQNAMARHVDLGFLVGCDLQASLIDLPIQVGLTLQTGLGFRGADKFQNGLVADQWMAGPVFADEGKQTMLNQIPF